MPTILQTMGWWHRPTAFVTRARARHGARFSLRLIGLPPVVMLSDPADLRELFTAAPDVLHPGEGARVLEPLVGRHSVILLDEGAHMEQRKLLLPAFHGDRMQRLTGLVTELTEREIASWPTGTAVTLHPRLQRLTLEVILRAVFGLDEGARLDALRDRLGAILSFGDSPLSLLPAAQQTLSGRGRFGRFERDRAEVDRELLALIAERRASGEARDDVLAMLLAATHTDGSPMHDEEIRDELLTALVAGHETTASSLAFAFGVLARFPAVAERLATGDDDAYLEATINEVMRCRPVLPNAAPRLTKQPVTIGGWTYPAGVVLVCASYLVHHDPAIYPEPYAFRPERFLGTKPGTYTWLPFGGGRRRCLGASFALLEMRIVLREALRRFTVAPAPGASERARRRMITITPAGGATVVLGDRPPAERRDAPPAEEVVAA